MIEAAQQSQMRGQSYYPWFDWMRLTLALLVVASHEGILNGLPQAGNFAVQLFFALSGWLIGGFLLGVKPEGLPRFYFNRSLRIWIPYFLALALLILVSLIRDKISLKWLEFVFFKATFVYNLFGPSQIALFRDAMPLQGTGNHFWSVNAEEQFYLLAPLLLVVLPREIGRSRLLWLVLAVAAWTTSFYASIVFGVLAAVAARDHRSLMATRTVRFGAAFVFLVVMLALHEGFEYRSLVPFSAIAAVLALAVQGKQSVLGKWAGGVSYPLYLNHWIGLFAAHSVMKKLGLLETVAHHALAIVLSVVVGCVAYALVDSRIPLLRTQTFSTRNGKMAMGFAYASVAVGLGVGLWLGYRPVPAN